MVGYLTDNLWKTYIPEDIQAEVQTDDHVDDALKVFWSFFDAEKNNILNESSHYIGIQNHLKLCQQYHLDSLKDVWVSPEQLRSELVSLGCDHKEDARLCINDFMSEKKTHEVEITSQVGASIIYILGHSINQHIIFFSWWLHYVRMVDINLVLSKIYAS